MITIVERPSQISWSGNQVRYLLQTNTPTATEGLEIQLRIYFKPFDGVIYEQLFSQPAYPDASGRVELYIHSILDTQLKYKLPALVNNAPESMYGQVGTFYIEYREVTTATPDPAWTSDQANTLYVIKGGISNGRWQGANYFETYFNIYKPFLTWQVSGRLCRPNERMYLYFLMPRPANGAVTVKVKVVYTDATVDNSLSLLFPDVPGTYAIYAIPSGITQLGLLSLIPAKTIYYYEISVEDAGGILANPFRYLPDYRNSYNTTQFNFVNSLGGLDSLPVLGEIEPSLDREVDTGEITAGYNNDENQIALHQFVYTLTIQEVFKGDAGFVGKKQQHYLSELFFSRHCWEMRFNRWWPVIITNKSAALAKSTDILYTVPIEWMYGFRDSYFTPDFSPVTTFGTCPIIIAPLVTLGAEEDTVTWTGNVAHTGYRVHLFYQAMENSPVAQSYINTAVPSISVEPGYRSWIYIKAICAFNESQEVGPIKIRD
jgi:hypothetical protein